jgi:hypothetical protein
MLFLVALYNDGYPRSFVPRWIPYLLHTLSYVVPLYCPPRWAPPRRRREVGSAPCRLGPTILLKQLSPSPPATSAEIRTRNRNAGVNRPAVACRPDGGPAEPGQRGRREVAGEGRARARARTRARTRARVRRRVEVSPEARDARITGMMSISIERAFRVAATVPSNSSPMQGYACEWSDCDKTYKKATDLERHVRTREHDDHILPPVQMCCLWMRLMPCRHRRAQLRLHGVRKELRQERRPLEAPRADPR